MAKDSMSHDFQIAPTSDERPIISWTIRELAGYSDEAFWADFARASRQRQEKIVRLGEQCGDLKESATSGTFDREGDRGSALAPIKSSRLAPTTAQNESDPKSNDANLSRVFSPTPFPRQEPTTAQKASLLAYMTLWDLLEQTYGIAEAPLFDYKDGVENDQDRKGKPSSEDGKSNKGKPTLADHPDVYFSLSHTDSAVLAAVANTPVGADIQVFHRPSERLLSHALSGKERRDLEGLDDQEKVLTFTQMWTRKEAFLKMTGKGIQSLRDLKQEVPQRAIFEEGSSAENEFAWSICAEQNISVSQ